MTLSILALDKNWNPHRWIPTEEAMVLEAKNLVLEHLGEAVYVYHGGTNRSGKTSELVTSSIIVIDGAPNPRKFREPALTNTALFFRDMYLCAYCGGSYKAGELTRDHIHPTSKGGRDAWINCITACKDCNALKGDLLPGQKLPNKQPGPQGTGRFDPLYVPYVPCKSEHMILRNRSVKADQMVFLLDKVVNKKSRIFDYAKKLNMYNYM
jgi:5-methylcytosine-specific restriction endonuclease McrA